MLSCPEHEESRAAANLFVHTTLANNLGRGYTLHGSAWRFANWWDDMLLHLFEIEDQPMSYPFTWETLHGKEFYLGYDSNLDPVVGCRRCQRPIMGWYFTGTHVTPRLAAEILLDKQAKDAIPHSCPVTRHSPTQ